MMADEYNVWADPFKVLLANVEAWETETQRQAFWLGGWEVDAPELRPPPPLRHRLRHRSSRAPERYAFVSDCRRAKHGAADILGRQVTFDGAPLSPDNVAILPSSSQAILLVLSALQGVLSIHNLVVTGPVYFSTIGVSRCLRISCHHAPAADLLSPTPAADDLAKDCRRRRAALFLTNPAYGVGVRIPEERLRHLLETIPQNIPIVLDEALQGLDWTPNRLWSALDLPPNAVVIRSPSKLFFMNGRKCSIVVAAPSLVRQIEHLADVLIGGIHSDLEDDCLVYLSALAAWFEEHRSGIAGNFSRWHQRLVARLEKNRLSLVPIFRSVGFELSRVDSGYYSIACRTSCVRPSLDAMAVLRETGVVLTESKYIFHENDRQVALRVNLGAEAEALGAAASRILPFLSGG